MLNAGAAWQLLHMFDGFFPTGCPNGGTPLLATTHGKSEPVCPTHSISGRDASVFGDSCASRGANTGQLPFGSGDGWPSRQDLSHHAQVLACSTSAVPKCLDGLAGLPAPLHVWLKQTAMHSSSALPKREVAACRDFTWCCGAPFRCPWEFPNHSTDATRLCLGNPQKLNVAGTVDGRDAAPLQDLDKPLFVGEFIIPGILTRCRTLPIHSMWPLWPSSVLALRQEAKDLRKCSVPCRQPYCRPLPVAQSYGCARVPP